MYTIEDIAELVKPITDDLTSGAAEIALRAINIFQDMLQGTEDMAPGAVKERLVATARALVDAQPAMAPLFHLSNTVLIATRNSQTQAQIVSDCADALTNFEKQLCDSAAKIADLVFDLIPPGELVFAYSFSTTVVSALLSARAKGRYFRAVCTESRPAMEGRKLATMLASGGMEVLHTFDSAMGLILPNCRAAFMGADSIGRPGLVNKVGSWPLALACRELDIPLYALAGTEKFVTDERLFEFEKHDRPAQEVWADAPKGVRILNHQFELIPFSLLAGVVTEQGILKEKDIEHFVSRLEVHDTLKLENTGFQT
jgi:translation initiation factor 2B subunit (eIF-2B alpha/beta/delta family)